MQSTCVAFVESCHNNKHIIISSVCPNQVGVKQSFPSSILQDFSSFLKRVRLDRANCLISSTRNCMTDWTNVLFLYVFIFEKFIFSHWLKGNFSTCWMLVSTCHHALSCRLVVLQTATCWKAGQLRGALVTGWIFCSSSLASLWASWRFERTAAALPPAAAFLLKSLFTKLDGGEISLFLMPLSLFFSSFFSAHSVFSFFAYSNFNELFTFLSRWLRLDFSLNVGVSLSVMFCTILFQLAESLRGFRALSG